MTEDEEKEEVKSEIPLDLSTAKDDDRAESESGKDNETTEWASPEGLLGMIIPSIHSFNRSFQHSSLNLKMFFNSY